MIELTDYLNEFCEFVTQYRGEKNKSSIYCYKSKINRRFFLIEFFDRGGKFEIYLPPPGAVTDTVKLAVLRDYTERRLLKL